MRPSRLVGAQKASNHPCRTIDDKIESVVVTFGGVAELYEAEQRWEGKDNAWRLASPFLRRLKNSISVVRAVAVRLPRTCNLAAANAPSDRNDATHVG